MGKRKLKNLANLGIWSSYRGKLINKKSNKENVRN
jgi:hypothetical protein